jgi:hypothetical protein
VRLVRNRASTRGENPVRFIIAIVLFVVAFVGIGVGIAERTLFGGPDRVTESLQLDSSSSVTVISGAALNALEGRQTLAIQGGVEASGPGAPLPTTSPVTAEADEVGAQPPTESDAIVVAYGTTADVLGWIGAANYTLITWDEETQELVAEAVYGTEIMVPSPIGSDLWFGEFAGEGDLTLTINAPEDVSLLMVTDGTLPAPQQFSITWPLVSESPLATPVTLAGFAALILGLLALVWALVHLRKQRGPRRKGRRGPKMPRVPKPSRYRPVAVGTSLGRPRGRRAMRRVALLPLGLVGVLAVSACGIGEGLDLPARSATPMETATSDPAPVLPPVAVTARQAERIIQRVAAAVVTADEEADADVAATRLAGPALELRQANYVARGNNSAVAALPPIPTGAIELVLPQQTDVWPRQVFAIVSDPNDETVAPVALLLTQSTARDQYRAVYVVTLEPQAQLPEVPPASLGTAFLGPDTPFLPVSPLAVVESYADVLLQGEEAGGYSLFSVESDSLRAQIGFEVKQARRDALPSTASFSFTTALGDADIITLSALDAGGLVFGYLLETETVKPTQAGAAVNASGAVAALARRDSSTKGITATYGVQVLFYVPSLENPDAPIILLGYTQGLVAASEVP